MEENVSTPASVRSVGIKYGVINGLISLVIFLVTVALSVNAFDQKWSWVGIVVYVVILILAHKNFKDTGDGFMSYGQGVGIGFWVTLIGMVIGVGIQFLYVTVIDPGVMEMFYAAQLEQMEEQGMPEEQIEMAQSWTRSLFWPMAIVMGLIFGVLTAVIVSIFTQKKRPEQTF